MEDVGGKSVDFAILGKLLSTAPVRPALLFLNACKSEAGAAVLTGSADIVIAMKDNVNDTTAFHYARRFYASLLTGLNVHDSHEQAKVVLSIDDPSGASLPSIHSASGVDPKSVSFR